MKTKLIYYILGLLFGLCICSSASAQGCCVNLRGNVNYSVDDAVDVSDLVFLVAYMFQSGVSPVCFEEADVDNSGGIDVSDLVYLVDFMFNSGSEPLECDTDSLLVFDDNFIGPFGQAPDPSMWNYDIGTDWGNAQLEYDTDRPYNVSLDGNGNLAIVAREESYLGQEYTSARIVTRGLFHTTYGRVEARIKLPYGQGIWPAFWLLGADIGSVGWPQCGEIDIMEYLGHETNRAYGTVHGPGYSAGGSIGTDFVLPSGNFNEDFHIFAIEWERDIIKWYIDDSMYFSVTPDSLNGNEWVFDHPFYIILNVAVGGAWPGSPNETTVFPQTMLVDYVRVYADTTSLSLQPTESAPVPTVDPVDVISIFSDSYSNITVDTWSADWDMADVTDFMINTDNMKRYDNLIYAGIEFASNTIDATSMSHLHLDLWTPDPTDAPSEMHIKLVDFGANGVWDGGGDDVEHEITINESTMNTGEWVSIDIPLSSFSGLTTRGHLAQLLISGDPNILFVDNLYLYDAHLPEEPQTSAPAPAFASGDVISLFSDVYANVPVDTWSAFWDVADVEDFTVGADNMKKYTNLLYAGIETISSTIDANSMTHFYINVWTPDATNAPSLFKVKLVDFGANGVWDGGGDDVEHEITFDESVMSTGSWVTLDIPLADFINLTTRGHMAQFIISGDPQTVFVDNILFHK